MLEPMGSEMGRIAYLDANRAQLQLLREFDGERRHGDRFSAKTSSSLRAGVQPLLLNVGA